MTSLSSFKQFPYHHLLLLLVATFTECLIDDIPFAGMIYVNQLNGYLSIEKTDLVVKYYILNITELVASEKYFVYVI